MSTTFNYTFETTYLGEPMDIEYEYEINIDEAKDYIRQVYSNDEIIEKDWNNLSEEDKEEVRKDFNFENDNFKSISDENKEIWANNAIVDLIYDSNVFDDELKDYFEQSAYENFVDEQESADSDEWLKNQSYNW